MRWNVKDEMVWSGNMLSFVPRVAREESLRIETTRESMFLPLLSDMHHEMGLEDGVPN